MALVSPDIPCAHHFLTFKPQELNVRTIGTIFLPPSEAGDEWDGSDAQALGRMFERCPDKVVPAARGKVVFIRERNGYSEVYCYQTKGRDASPTICGNAAAAAARLLAKKTNMPNVEFSLKATEVEVKVLATVGDCGCVSQEWLINTSATCEEFVVADRRTVSCNFLNPYLLLEGSVSERSAALLASVADRFGANLNNKYALIDSSGSIPQVRFFGCNGVHGAAPLSGIVTLALAAQRVEWIRRAFAGGMFEHPMGIELLPEVSAVTTNQALLVLPEIEVVVHAITIT